jgi:tetratricopeptide (TPR) repeat protein
LVEWGAIGLKLPELVLRLIGGRLYDRYLKYKIRRDIRLGSGKKLGILLARLADDTPTDSFRTTLYETIRRELGDAVELTNWPEIEALGDGHEYDIERRAYEKTQQVLKDRNCDLLVSGRVKGRSGDSAVLSLHFTVAEAAGGNPESYKLTDTFDLPADFVSDLGAAISARIIITAAPAIHMTGQYLVPILRAAAERFEPIVRRLNPRFNAAIRGSLLFNYGVVQAVIGEQAGLNDPLLKAIEAYRAALAERARNRAPFAWAVTKNSLGNALARLGRRDNNTRRLEQAIDAFQEALSEFTPENAPLHWAMAQTNLGAALRIVGERTDDIEMLGLAVQAQRNALLERTRERVPFEWALSQNNLGNALGTLGNYEIGTSLLEQAVTAFRAALTERTRDRVPVHWAETQGNLGNALRLLGEREAGTTHLEEATEAFHAAMLEFTREKMPIAWATAQDNLGLALQEIAKRKNSVDLINQAIAAHKQAIEAFKQAIASGPLEKASRHLECAELVLKSLRK